MKKHVFLLLFILGLSGCVGISEHTAKYTEDYEKAYQADVRKTYPFLPKKHYTKAGLLQAWGQPTSIIELENGNEQWVYPYTTFYQGIIIWAILPVPSLLPLDDLNLLVDFEQEKVKRILKEVRTGDMYACGPGISMASALSPSLNDYFCYFGD
ncbi:hypothetical protein [Enterovibrio norvegicus]|uniref:hypothetical protein n=1 Tax=Enterovibrio norvegicus TaxID=188144 RepID=UPI00352E42B4